MFTNSRPIRIDATTGNTALHRIVWSCSSYESFKASIKSLDAHALSNMAKCNNNNNELPIEIMLDKDIHRNEKEKIFNFLLPLTLLKDYKKLSTPIDQKRILSHYQSTATSRQAEVLKIACDIMQEVRKKFQFSATHPESNLYPEKELEVIGRKIKLMRQKSDFEVLKLKRHYTALIQENKNTSVQQPLDMELYTKTLQIYYDFAVKLGMGDCSEFSLVGCYYAHTQYGLKAYVRSIKEGDHVFVELEDGICCDFWLGKIFLKEEWGYLRSHKNIIAPNGKVYNVLSPLNYRYQSIITDPFYPIHPQTSLQRVDVIHLKPNGLEGLSKVSTEIIKSPEEKPRDPKSFWAGVILFFVFFSYFRDLFKSNYCPSATLVHDLMVISLTPDIICRDKTIGVSQGKICEIDNTTYFLKELPCNYLENSHEMISYEEYNKQFVRKNIEITVPRAHFFREKNLFYTGSEKVEDLKFFTPQDPPQFFQEKMSTQALAKLMVATTFVRDMNNLQNWGYSGQELIILDLDSATTFDSSYYPIPITTKDFVKFVVDALDDVPIALSVNILKEMHKIYDKMQHFSLPKYYKQFHQDPKTYLEVLDVCMLACEKAIKKIETTMPGIKPNQLTKNINRILKEELILISCEKDDSLCISSGIPWRAPQIPF